jgi:predicted nucleic acid-binding protein
MQVLIDTNVLLDVALMRPSFSPTSGEAIIRCGRPGNTAFVAWHSLSNIYYIVRKQANSQTALQCVIDVLRWAKVADVGHEDALWAISHSTCDFEDALQVSAAKACCADIILTRNTSDFANSPVPAITPEAFLQFG